ncbi:MAG: GxxExxY protein [Kiritimatiellales bacterium]|nr:GxxExxY protein [Pontiella sp.]NNJ70791.1 GxxExxY protein [Kiritimatiellales bacterium]
MVDLNTISHDIIQAAIEIHKELGPGLLESVYRKCLAKVLRDNGYDVKEELYLPVTFRGETIEDKGYRIDLLVDDRVVVEVKSVEEMKPLFSKQTGTYLKLMRLQLGLLINFNVPLLKDGVKRIVNDYRE